MSQQSRTAAYGSSASGTKCRTATSRSATGRLKSISSRTAGSSKNDARISKICFNYRRPRDIRQNCASLRYSDRIIVDIHHVRLRILALSYLVHISRGRNPRADVDELSYSLADQVPHSPAHEIPIRLHHERKLRPKTNSLLRHPPVHLEIMRTTQVVVIHSGSARA